jgi:NAD(P)-dependent dehydrogenase (short-subunit alcohol dehydrogenase family)
MGNNFSTKDKAVLITGCSSGIGRATALELAGRGLTVFATVRKESDAQALNAFGLPTLIPVWPVDLTRREDISRAVAQVSTELERRGLDGLYGLIHNAGGGFIAPLELFDLDRFQAELATRLVAPVALTQACLPLIRRTGGRVLWIATPGLIPTPYIASIHACDFAANCLARTLALELRPWRIPSVMIRCGGIRSAAPEKNDAELAEALQRWPAERAGLYAAALGRLQAELADFDRQRSDPQAVAHVVYTALTAAHPRPRYQVGHLAGAAAFLELLPQTLADALLARRG